MHRVHAVVKWMVPVLMIGAGAFGPAVAEADALQQDTHIAALAYATACAEEDGSCGPAPNYVCGLNGKNYSEKVYVPVIE